MNEEQQITLDLLYSKYYRELLQYSFSFFDCRQQYLQDAEDCVQDTFEKAMKNLDRVLKNEAPLKYLKRMCKKYHNFTTQGYSFTSENFEIPENYR